jgi:hypothetical protein
MKKRSGGFWQRVALGAVFVLVALYTFYHLLGLFDSEMETYAAGVSAETRVLRYNGYLFRNETVLISTNEGVVDYRVKDGVKVSEGQALADVYAEGDYALREQIRRIDRQIELLEEGLEEDALLPDMAEVKADLREQYLGLVKQLADRNPASLAEHSGAFLAELNRMDSLIYGEESSGEVSLEHLRQMRREIFELAGDSVVCASPKSGIFYTEIDGFESLFTMEAASEEMLTVDSFARLIAATERTGGGEDGAYGKLWSDGEWRFVISVPRADASYFEAGAVHVGGFGAGGETEVPMTVEFVKECPEAESFFVVFRGDRMPKDFFRDRSQTVSLEVERTEGIYVPKHVVVRESGGKGVYILRGSVVRFRYVEILYEGNNYYLVKPDLPTDDHGREFLQVNDIIILNGKNLFDGRVMD